MPVARYFLFVGGMLVALLFALDAFAPQQTVVASNAVPSINKTVVRIRSDQKLPERVVYDTSLPDRVPIRPPRPPWLRIAGRTFAQFVPAEAKSLTSSPRSVSRCALPSTAGSRSNTW